MGESFSFSSFLYFFFFFFKKKRRRRRRAQTSRLSYPRSLGTQRDDLPLPADCCANEHFTEPIHRAFSRLPACSVGMTEEPSIASLTTTAHRLRTFRRHHPLQAIRRSHPVRVMHAMWGTSLDTTTCMLLFRPPRHPLIFALLEPARRQLLSNIVLGGTLRETL